MPRITSDDLKPIGEANGFYVKNTGAGYDSLKKSRKEGKQSNSDINYALYREVNGQYVVGIKRDFANPKLTQRLENIATFYDKECPVNTNQFNWNPKDAKMKKKSKEYHWWTFNSQSDCIKTFKGLILIELNT